MRRSKFPPVRPLVLPSQAETEALAKKVLGMLSAKRAVVSVSHNISARAQYTRNEVRTVSGNTSTGISISVDFNGRQGGGGTNRVDEKGLREFIDDLETATKEKRDAADPMDLAPPATFTDPPIYFQGSLDAGDPEWQGDLMRSLAGKAEQAAMVGAADARVSVNAMQVLNTDGFTGYTRDTTADLSMTARTKSGKGSGWCWDGGYDMSLVDSKRVSDYAIDIAGRSDNPQAVEPGRYTVILEPAAVEGLISPITSPVTSYMGARAADLGFTVFSKKGGGNKIGLQMADRRVLFESNPYDQLVPYSPLSPDGTINKRMEWIEKGILRNLWYNRSYAREVGREPNYPPGNSRLEVVGMTPKSLPDMIKETQRGIWIHRFAGIGVFSARTLLLSGVTRDGAFLIENGKITKPIKNLRFSESPFFMLNKIDAVGVPERTQGRFALPRIKAHDFEFIALSEAV